MENGYSRKNEEIHPQLLDLIPKERNWFVNGDNNDHVVNGDEKKLELRLGPPCVEDWSVSDAQKNYKSSTKTASQKRYYFIFLRIIFEILCLIWSMHVTCVFIFWFVCLCFLFLGKAPNSCSFVWTLLVVLCFRILESSFSFNFAVL